jgi:hypothetical protein
MTYINLSLQSIEAVLLIDSEGKKLLSKYYKEIAEPAKFEKQLYDKTKKQSSFLD